MQAKRLFIKWTPLMLAGAIMLPGPGNGHNQSKFTHFTGTQTILGYADPGEWIFSDPTFTDPNTYLKQIRGMVRQSRELCDDIRETGWSDVVVNANLRPDGSGRLWGSFISTKTSYEGGWEGTYTARTGADGSLSLRGVSRGTGEHEGLHTIFTIEYPPAAGPLAPSVGVIDGYIIEKSSRKDDRGRKNGRGR